MRSPRSPAIKLAQAYRAQAGLDYISAMPTNLYGPGDNYDLESSHVIPALLRKAVEARDIGAETMTVWGTGTPRREFMHVDDLADALVFLLRSYSEDQHINVGVGDDVTIAELAQTVADVVGFKGRLVFDATRPRRHATQADGLVAADRARVEAPDRAA